MNKVLSAIILCCLSFFSVSAVTPILGTQQATVDRMYEFVKSKNNSFDREIAQQFYAVGQVYGVRGDIALCQSIIETGWFKFSDGTAVTPDQHNYSGLGVTSLGQKGESFATIKDGVTAQIQHLYAYACTKALPDGEVLIDNRFKYVTRGCAPNWEDLGGKWSGVSTYGTQIIEKYNEMMAFTMSGSTTPTPTPNPSSASITASEMNISLSGVKGGTAPSKTITITGANLSGGISYNSSTSAFKVTTSNWNSTTGGSMTITLDTSKAVGSYSGYIAVQSGSTRIEIQCSATITENTTVPTIKASKMELNFNAVKGGTAPSQTVTITGTNITTEMTFNSASSAFKVNSSNWNAYTGGTLTITLDTSKDAGNYESYVAVQSGTGADKVRIEIACKATITDSQTIPALSFTEGWNLSETAGLSSNYEWIKNVRNFDYANGNIYCIYNNCEVRVLDARSGIYYKDLQVPASVITGTAYQLCDIKCIDGGIIACNLVTTSSGGELRFYQWANDNAAPTLLYSTQVTERAGDCLGVAGTLSGTLRLVTGNSSGVITEYTRTNGSWSKKTISTGLSSGTSTRVIPVSGGYHVDGRGILPTMVNTAGTVLYSLTSNETSKDGNGFDTFTYNGKNYLMTAVYLTNTTATLDEGAMRLYDVTAGWANGTAVGAYPSNGLGSYRNTNLAGGVVTNAGSNYAEAWVLTQGQGLAYYKSGNAPAPNASVGIDSMAQETEASIAVKDNSVIVCGSENAQLRLITMTGAVAASSNTGSISLYDIESGIYIALATLENGKNISAKIAVK